MLPSEVGGNGRLEGTVKLDIMRGQAHFLRACQILYNSLTYFINITLSIFLSISPTHLFCVCASKRLMTEGWKIKFLMVLKFSTLFYEIHIGEKCFVIYLYNQQNKQLSTANCCAEPHYYTICTSTLQVCVCVCVCMLYFVDQQRCH